jgi:hypothetical protein
MQAGRSSFGRMVDYLQRHPGARIILVDKTDRLYRNLKGRVPSTSWTWRSTSSKRTSSCQPIPDPPRSS